MKKIITIIIYPFAFIGFFLWSLFKAILIAFKHNGLEALYFILFLPIQALRWIIFVAYVLILSWNVGYFFKWAPHLMGFLDRYFCLSGWRLYRTLVKMRDYGA